MTQATPTREAGALRVGMIGYAFMGAAHSVGWRNAPRVFDLPLRPELAVLAGRDAAAVTAAADRLGWAEIETDWRALLTREDIDLIDVCTPGDSHAEIAIAALEAGKHVLCEKPLANTVTEAEAMVAAAEAAAARGQVAMVGFNYRRVPAMALARQWIAENRLGTIRQVRAQYLQDWIIDPQFPLVWRLRKELAGSGALGDVGSFEATRFATGRKNALRIEVNGSDGSLAFDMEAMNELSYYDNREPATSAGFRRILVTESDHPYLSAWWPPGHIIGYEHTFVHEIRDLVTAIGTGTPVSPTFADGLQVQRVLDAVEHSAANHSTWQEIAP